jgi:hypothetical protein
VCHSRPDRSRQMEETEHHRLNTSALPPDISYSEGSDPVPTEPIVGELFAVDLACPTRSRTTLGVRLCVRRPGQGSLFVNPLLSNTTGRSRLALQRCGRM